MSATMRDVARLAGVSVKTVSNVVNEFPHVSAGTRRRVHAAIEQLGYRMNHSARSLSRGRTGLVSLAVPQLRLPYFAELADAVIAAAEERGLRVLIEQTGGVRDRELAVLDGDDRRMTDGLILAPIALRTSDRPLLRADPPLVLLGERQLTDAVDHVTMANRDGARAVTEHLLATGRRAIALVGTFEPGEEGAGSLRTRGFLDALGAAGLAYDERRTGAALDWTREAGAAAMADVLARDVGIDAVLALNDALALGAMRALFEAGVRVPEDVAVAGFDDIREAAFARPGLTTVQPGLAQIARTAVELLLDQVDARTTGRLHVPRHDEVGCTLVVRESTA